MFRLPTWKIFTAISIVAVINSFNFPSLEKVVGTSWRHQVPRIKTEAIEFWFAVAGYEKNDCGLLLPRTGQLVNSHQELFTP